MTLGLETPANATVLLVEQELAEAGERRNSAQAFRLDHLGEALGRHWPIIIIAFGLLLTLLWIGTLAWLVFSPILSLILGAL
jgi:hypothetical protein